MRRLVLIAATLLTGLLTVAPVLADSTGADEFSAFAMRPLPGNVTVTPQGWSLPFATRTWSNNGNLPAGTGTYFTYQTWFQMDTPHTLYDGIPMVTPKQDVKPFTMQGQVVVRDRSGSRVLESASIVQGGITSQVFSMFADGSTLYQQDGTRGLAGLIPLKYSAPVPPGIEAFLKGVKINGIVRDNTATGDTPMSALLAACGARQLATSRNGQGLKARQIVYGIAAGPYDQALGYQYLQVTVRVGDFKIVRSELALPYGTERTDYGNVLDGIQFDDAMFLKVGETVADLPPLN